MGMSIIETLIEIRHKDSYTKLQILIFYEQQNRIKKQSHCKSLFSNNLNCKILNVKKN